MAEYKEPKCPQCGREGIAHADERPPYPGVCPGCGAVFTIDVLGAVHLEAEPVLLSGSEEVGELLGQLREEEKWLRRLSFPLGLFAAAGLYLWRVGVPWQVPFAPAEAVVSMIVGALAFYSLRKRPKQEVRKAFRVPSFSCPGCGARTREQKMYVRRKGIVCPSCHGTLCVSVAPAFASEEGERGDEGERVVVDDFKAWVGWPGAMPSLNIETARVEPTASYRNTEGAAPRRFHCVAEGTLGDGVFPLVLATVLGLGGFYMMGINMLGALLMMVPTTLLAFQALRAATSKTSILVEGGVLHIRRYPDDFLRGSLRLPCEELEQIDVEMLGEEKPALRIRMGNGKTHRIHVPQWRTRPHYNSLRVELENFLAEERGGVRLRSVATEGEEELLADELECEVEAGHERDNALWSTNDLDGQETNGSS